MAQPDIIRGTYFSLMIGDGATPTETFLALCGITTRTFTDQVNTQEVFTRDCADPENVPIRRLIVTGRQWSLSGEGTLNRANLAALQAAIQETKNYRFIFTEPADDEVYQGYYEGPAKLVSLVITASDENMATVSIQIESDGQWDFTPVT